MIAFAVGLGALAAAVAYIRRGWAYAVADLPDAWTRARAFWGPANHRYVVESVRWSFVRMLVLWPGIRLVHVFDAALQSGDPKTIARRHKEASMARARVERRTAELEAWHQQWTQTHPDPLETI